MDVRLNKAWEAFCDTHAPMVQSGKGKGKKPMRDPRRHDSEFLLSFVTHSLENDDEQTGGAVAEIIDNFQYEFRSAQDVDDRPSRQPRGGGGNGAGDSAPPKGKGKGKGKEKQPARQRGQSNADAILSRMVKIVQRSSDVIKQNW